jgi:multidrug efflux pump
MVIGMVICSGVAVATLLTVYIVPMAYVALARNTGSPHDIARQLESLDPDAK